MATSSRMSAMISTRCANRPVCQVNNNTCERQKQHSRLFPNFHHDVDMTHWPQAATHACRATAD
jgi:DNA-directed RNA polymerase